MATAHDAKVRASWHRAFAVDYVGETQREKWNRVVAERYQGYYEGLKACEDGGTPVKACADMQALYRKFDEDVVRQMRDGAYRTLPA